MRKSVIVETLGIVGTLGIALLVSNVAFAAPAGGGKNDPTPHPTPAPSHSASSTPAPSATPAPAAPAAPPAPAPANSPMPGGNWDLTVVSTATSGHPSQTLNLDAQVTTNGAVSTIATRPLPGAAAVTSTNLSLSFTSDQHCTGTATIDGTAITFTGTALPTSPPSVGGTFKSVDATGKTATGTFSLKLNVSPIAQMPLKQYGAPPAGTPAPNLWQRFKSWCGSFAL